MNLAIFLGGTVGNNSWRERFIDQLVAQGIDRSTSFNPVVPAGQWNDSSRNAEALAKDQAQILFFYIGHAYHEENTISPYSLAEAVLALVDDPDRAVVVIDTTGLNNHSLEAAKACRTLLKNKFPAAPIFSTLEEALNEIVGRLMK